MDIRQIEFKNKIQSFQFVVLASSIFYSLSFLLWNEYPDDAYYWFNYSDNYSDSFMQCFTLWIGYLWKNSIGFSLFSFKFLGWLMSIAGLLIPFYTMLDKKEREKGVFCLSAAIMIMGNWNHQMYNNDSLTCLFLICIGCLLYGWNNITLKRTIVLTIITAILVASRFPNVVIVPAMFLYILVENKTIRQRFINALFFLLISFLAHLVIICLLCKRFDYFDFLMQSWNNANTSTHNLNALLVQYTEPLKHAVDLLLVIFGLISILYLFELRLNNKIVHFILVIGFIVLLKAQDEFYMFAVHSWHSACSFLFAFFGIFVLRQCKIKWIYILMFCFLGCVCIAGSDTAFLKLYPFFVSFLPVFLAKVRTPNNRIKTVVTLSLCIFSIWFFLRPLRQQIENGIQYEGNTRFLCFIKKDEYDFLSRNSRVILEKNIKPEDIIFMGFNSHKMYCYYGNKVPEWYSFKFNNITKISDGMQLSWNKNKDIKFFDFDKSESIKTILLRSGHHISDETKDFILYEY